MIYDDEEISKFVGDECGNIFPIYEVHYESEMKDSLETIQTPFENSESIFISVDNRKTQRKKRESRDTYRLDVHRHTSKRWQTTEVEDPEI